MSNHIQDNKRIAKNTLMLYIRMLLIMGVTLYTSRIVLEQLGIEDYGIYNVVGGIIVLFSFITNSLQLASQRYYSYELEKSPNLDVTHVFKASLNLYIIFSLLFIVICQTLGYWILITKLNIPIERKAEAIWVFEISIITGVISIFRIPYNALIIAHEKIPIYAKYSIIEVILKVASIVALIYIKFDKLILYSILVGITTLLTNIVYMRYCHKELLHDYQNVKPQLEAMKGMLSFSSWMLLLGVANVSATQGINFILNIAYGVVINAAIGVANQVNSAVSQFITNFQTSFNPQLIKLYASKSFENLKNLLFNASRLSFLLLLILSWPIIINVNLILSIWLTDVPEYSGVIITWVLIYGLIDTFVNPIAIVVHATGEIKRYQFIASLFILSIIPLCFICIHYRIPPYAIFVCRAGINLFSLIWRIFYVKDIVYMTAWDYYSSVLKPCIRISILSLIFYLLGLYLHNEIYRLIYSIIIWFFILLPAIYFMGILKNERVFIKNYIKKIIHIN